MPDLMSEADRKIEGASSNSTISSFIANCSSIPTFQFILQHKLMSLAFLIATGLASYLMLQLRTSPYVWQVTKLEPSIHPSARSSCAFSSSNISTPLSTQRKKLRIGLVYVFAQSAGSSGWSAELVEDILDNRRRYCELYGYTLLNGSQYIDYSRPVAWSKLLAMKHYLRDFDYVFYVDMDVVIMNSEHRLEDFIDAAKPQSDIIMTSDWKGPNTGIWFARNSTWSAWFLDELYNQDQLVHRQSSTGINHPFAFEQRALHYILQTEIWRERSLPVYPGDTKAIAQHIHLFPQCAFNSYVLFPYDFKTEHDGSEYVNGDFLIHLAGVKGQRRVDLLNYYLAKSRRNWKKPGLLRR